MNSNTVISSQPEIIINNSQENDSTDVAINFDVIQDTPSQEIISRNFIKLPGLKAYKSCFALIFITLIYVSTFVSLNKSTITHEKSTSFNLPNGILAQNANLSGHMVSLLYDNITSLLYDNVTNAQN